MEDSTLEDANVHWVDRVTDPELSFSVWSLVASRTKYRRLVESFVAKGFDASNTEFHALDNTNGNLFDGYSGLRYAAPRARGKYILYTHDDIELTDDGFEELVGILADLTAKDPGWVVAGNAGAPFEAGLDTKPIRHIRDPYGASTDLTRSTRAASLDENFLVLRRDRLVLPSLDLSGFHHFASDMCLQAELSGGTAHLIPFLLTHHSGGKISEAYMVSEAAFQGKYGAIFPGRILRTPSRRIPLGPAAERRLRITEFLKRVRAKLSR